MKTGEGEGGVTYEATHNPFCLTANLSLELAEMLILDADVRFSALTLKPF